MNLFALFALNAVYQEGAHAAYPLLPHRLLCVGIVLLPVISLLALYGLYLRVDQYGLTVARCWALLISLLITLLSFGYAGSVARFREQWTANLARVNLPMSMLMIALILLLNSPLLDFRKISLASQQGRVERGEIPLQEFDFFDARANMGRPAYLWMQEVIEENRESNPELAQLALEPVRPFFFSGYRVDPEDRIDFGERATFRPGPFEIPAALDEEMQNSIAAISASRDEAMELILIQADLDADGAPEYVLAADLEGSLVASGFQMEEGGAWRQFRLTPRLSSFEPRQDLANGVIEVVDQQYRDLRIGDIVLQVLDQ